MAEMPPEAAAPAPQQPEAQEGGADPVELLKSTQSALTMIATLFDQTQGVPPEAKQKMAQIVQDYTEVVSAVMQGGAAPQGAPQGGGQMASMEAGGNPNARPM